MWSELEWVMRYRADKLKSSELGTNWDYVAKNNIARENQIFLILLRKGSILHWCISIWYVAGVFFILWGILMVQMCSVRWSFSYHSDSIHKPTGTYGCYIQSLAFDDKMHVLLIVFLYICWSDIRAWTINSSPPGQNGCRFADDNSICISVNTFLYFDLNAIEVYS